MHCVVATGNRPHVISYRVLALDNLTVTSHDEVLVCEIYCAGCISASTPVQYHSSWSCGKFANTWDKLGVHRTLLPLREGVVPAMHTLEHGHPAQLSGRAQHKPGRVASNRESCCRVELS